MSPGEASHSSRPQLRWTAILFALAANLLLTTGAHILVTSLQFSTDYEILATVIGPFVAGSLTALYGQQRGGMHAFIGGALSVPLLMIYVFPGLWQLAVFAGAFCTLGGASTEIIMRRRPSSD